MSSVCKILSSFFTKDKQAIGDGIFNVGSGQSMTVWEMACLTQNRCEKQLNQKIPLSRTGTSNKTIDLEYSIKKLEDAGIAIKVDHVKEIDMLASFCVNNFCK
jgi:UDP-glucose 4-epimerase